MSEIVTAKNRVSLQAALGALPIFPLGQVALFPNALLPLHIFEPRYQAMLKDVLETHGALAIAHVEDPADVDALGNPKISSIAGAGVIVEHELLPGGSRQHRFARRRSRGFERAAVRFSVSSRAWPQVIADSTNQSVASSTSARRCSGAATAFASAVRRHDASFTFQMPPTSTAPRSPTPARIICWSTLPHVSTFSSESDVAERVRFVTSELVVQKRDVVRCSRAEF